MSKNEIAVIGTGPSGLLAAHAAEMAGARVTLITDDRSKKPFLGGAQYLHRAIPRLTEHEPDAMVLFAHVGTEDGYADKVYGDPKYPTSWSRFEGWHNAWNMERTMTQLAEYWMGRVVERQIQPKDLFDYAVNYKLVVCTAPRPAVCLDPDHHAFEGMDIHVCQGKVEAALGHNTVVYSGDPADEWSRMSILWGKAWWEFPEQKGETPFRTATKTLIKPMSHDCDCHRYDNLLFAGRFGRWDKNELSSDVWNRMRHALYRV